MGGSGCQGHERNFLFSICEISMYDYCMISTCKINYFIILYFILFYYIFFILFYLILFFLFTSLLLFEFLKIMFYYILFFFDIFNCIYWKSEVVFLKHLLSYLCSFGKLNLVDLLIIPKQWTWLGSSRGSSLPIEIIVIPKHYSCSITHLCTTLIRYHDTSHFNLKNL